MKVEGEKGKLEILFTSPHAHSKGVGYAAWCEIEKRHTSKVKVWGLVASYSETRDIYFYVYRCGFHIVEFYNSHRPDPNDLDFGSKEIDDHFLGDMFRFEKGVTSYLIFPTSKSAVQERFSQTFQYFCWHCKKPPVERDLPDESEKLQHRSVCVPRYFPTPLRSESRFAPFAEICITAFLLVGNLF